MAFYLLHNYMDFIFVTNVMIYFKLFKIVIRNLFNKIIIVGFGFKIVNKRENDKESGWVYFCFFNF
ncbi:hypothetical protein CKY13_15855 [Enterococcus hirae]|nr:hypothetical protein CKY13_15855 [Enterococcus hirae]